jgi:hypothetical protein
MKKARLHWVPLGGFLQPGLLESAALPLSSATIILFLLGDFKMAFGSLSLGPTSQAGGPVQPSTRRLNNTKEKPGADTTGTGGKVSNEAASYDYRSVNTRSGSGRCQTASQDNRMRLLLQVIRTLANGNAGTCL